MVRISPAGSLLVAATVLTLGACGPGTYLRREGGVEVRRLAPDAPPPRQGLGYAGEWVISRPGMALVVAGEVDDPRRRRTFGSIVDAVVAQAAEDELRGLTPVVRIGAEDLTLEPVRVEAGAGQTLSIVHEGPGGLLRVITDVRLLPEEGVALITTRLWNSGPDALEDVAIGDRVIWPDGPSFVPGLGLVTEATRRRAAWVARPGKRLSYALLSAGHPFDLTFGFEAQGSRDVLALGEPASLPAGGTLVHQRYLVVAPGPFPRVLNRVWHEQGMETGDVQGRVSPAPPWARIEVHGEDGLLAMADADADGRFALSLPLGTYRLVAHCPGGEDTTPLTLSRADPAAEIAFTAPAVGMLRYHVTDGLGRPSPARLTIVGVAPTRTPILAAQASARGAGNVAYTADGKGEIPLPPGEYEVYVSRGPEYSLHRQRVAVSALTGAVLRASLEREYERPGWIAADLHVHAAPSFDCEVSLEDRMIALVAEGLDGAVATDHNVITDYAGAAAAMGHPIVTVPGVEVTTFDPNLGHFNVWPLPVDAAPPPFVGQDAHQLLDEIARLHPAAVVQVNHPRMSKYGIGYFDLQGFDPRIAVAEQPGFASRFDAVELLNGTELDDPGVRDAVIADWLALLSSGLRVTATAGSDSHHLYDQWMGWPRTYLRGVVAPDGGGVPAEELAAGVRSGAAVISNGLFVELTVDGAAPGETVTTAGGVVRVVVRVHAASWIPVESVAIWHDGEIVAEGGCGGRAAAERCSLSLRLPVDHDGWIAAVAIGAPLASALPGLHGPAFGLANPVHVQVADEDLPL